jgi:GTP cyclohydrolase IA
MSAEQNKAEQHLRAVLEHLGFDNDPECQATPAAFLEFLGELDPRRPPPSITLLDTESTDPVVLRDMGFYSLCAHHLVPFLGQACVAIRPAGRLVGLGSIARLMHHHAARPQIQERMGAQLAEDLMERLGARTVFVHLRARHLCMEMRGARTPAWIETLAWRGEDDPQLRALLADLVPGGPTTSGGCHGGRG